MKTVMGQNLLKQYSKEMEELNAQMIEYAKKFAAMKKNNASNYSTAGVILYDAAQNRKLHQDRQERINEVVALENWLQFTESEG